MSRVYGYTRLASWKNEPYAHDAAFRGSLTRTSGRSLDRSVGVVALAKQQQSKRASSVASRGTETSPMIWSLHSTNSVTYSCPEKGFAVTAIVC